LLEEGQGGEIVNVTTGLPFSASDACVSLGATLGYDANATAEATSHKSLFNRDAQTGSALLAAGAALVQPLTPVLASRPHYWCLAVI